MNRKKKAQKYFQVNLGSSQSPMCLSLGNGMEIYFATKRKKRKEIWIPPPAKTSKKARSSFNRKYPKNQITLKISDDGIEFSPNGFPLRLESSPSEQFKVRMQPKTLQTISDTRGQLENEIHKIKDNFNTQKRALNRAQELLNDHEHRRKYLSKYVRTLKMEIEDLNRTINKVEKQPNSFLKAELENKHKSQPVASKYKDPCQESEVQHSVFLRKQVLSKGNGSKKIFKNDLKNMKSLENLSVKKYSNIESKTETVSKSRKGQDTVSTIEDTSKDLESDSKCVGVENLMVKLADNLRRTKIVLDSVYREDEIIESMQKKYIETVESLYEQQQNMLETIDETLDFSRETSISNGNSSQTESNNFERKHNGKHAEQNTADTTNIKCHVSRKSREKNGNHTENLRSSLEDCTPEADPYFEDYLKSTNANILKLESEVELLRKDGNLQGSRENNNILGTDKGNNEIKTRKCFHINSTNETSSADEARNVKTYESSSKCKKSSSECLKRNDYACEAIVKHRMCKHRSKAKNISSDRDISLEMTDMLKDIDTAMRRIKAFPLSGTEKNVSNGEDKYVTIKKKGKNITSNGLEKIINQLRSIDNSPPPTESNRPEFFINRPYLSHSCTCLFQKENRNVPESCTNYLKHNMKLTKSIHNGQIQSSISHTEICHCSSIKHSQGEDTGFEDTDTEFEHFSA